MRIVWLTKKDARKDIVKASKCVFGVNFLFNKRMKGNLIEAFGGDIDNVMAVADFLWKRHGYQITRHEVEEMSTIDDFCKAVFAKMIMRHA